MKTTTVKKQCSIEHCSSKVLARTWCGKHYMRNRVTGSPHTPTSMDARPAMEEDGYVKLPLGRLAKQGYALVDNKYKHLDKHKWIVTSHGYVSAEIDGKQQYLHRVVMNATDEPKEQYIDHINHDKLDNRMTNLRFATNSQNQANRSVTHNKTGYRGVVLTRHATSYTVFFGNSRTGSRKVIGGFKTAREAAKEYDRLAKERYGEYAQLNFA